ncbi:transposase [Natrialbaceae archaeon A-CW1-1]
MVETTEAKQVSRSASTVVYPALDFGIKPCGSYTREDFEKLPSHVTFEQEFATTAGKNCQLNGGEPVDVTSTARNGLDKSLLYHLRNLQADAIELVVDGVRNDLFEIPPETTAITGLQ